MDYKKYQYSRDAAWQILLDCRIKKLPVDIVSVCKQLGIEVRYYIPTDDNDGVSMLVDGKPVILASQLTGLERQRFTIAHELGHILLGHVGKYQLCNREPSRGDNPIEHEANVFASRLLAPACVLWGCNAYTTDQIMTLCQISRQAAGYRAERMVLLIQRNKFLTLPLERNVYRRFRSFIAHHKCLTSGS